jgi:hypothetical protein
MKNLDPKIWLPHFWFFLYSVAHSYPEFPNSVTKRKYYDFIQNFPLYCPDAKMQSIFIQVLDYFPVTPYLDNKDSITYWVHFIHNKVDQELGREEHTYWEHLDMYYNEYLPKSYSFSQRLGIEKRHIYYMFIAFFSIFIIMGTVR